MSINICKDNTETSFGASEHEAFREYIAEVDAETVWDTFPLSSVVYAPCSTVVADDLYIGGEDELEDTKLSGVPLVANLPDGKIALMRPYLWKQIKQHHRDTSPIIGDMANAGNWEKVCEHLNLGREYLKKSILCMTRGSKISGWFTEFNTNRTQSQQLDMLEAQLDKAFPNYKFASGCFNHLYTEASYFLDNSVEDASSLLGEDSVMAAYTKTWKECGMEGDIARALPMVRFLTGESGMTSIVLSPYIVFPDESTMPLGPSLSLKHRGTDEAVWGKFTEFGSQIAAMYQSGMHALHKLCETKIYHPYSTITRALKPFLATAPWAPIHELVESYQTFYDPEDEEQTCLAIDIYNSINDFVNGFNADVKSPMRRLQNKENVARLLMANWQEMDVKKPINLFPKKEAKTSIFEEEEF